MPDTEDSSSSLHDTNGRNLKAIVGDFLKKFKGFKSKAFSLIQNNSITTRNLCVSAGTYGLERLLNAEAFHCPEETHKLYGFTFLFAPVIILFCINVLVIGEVWKLSSRMCVERYKRHGDCMARVVPRKRKPRVHAIHAQKCKNFFFTFSGMRRQNSFLFSWHCSYSQSHKYCVYPVFAWSFDRFNDLSN